MGLGKYLSIYLYIYLYVYIHIYIYIYIYMRQVGLGKYLSTGPEDKNWETRQVCVYMCGMFVCMGARTRSVCVSERERARARARERESVCFCT